jgi:hypothetical protein
MKKTLLFVGVLLCSVNFAKAQCSELFISEYVEGWSNNKAIEIYNPTAQSINLGNYIVARASNGTVLDAVQVKYAVQLSGTIAPYSTYVGVVDLRDPNGSGLTDPIWDSLEVKGDGFYSPVYTTNSTFYWNGNDAILLLKGTLTGSATTTLISINPPLSIVDIFGKIGEDPGVNNGWTSLSPYTGAGKSVTVDHSLIRKPNVLKGVIDDAIAYFNPLAEYDSIPAVTYVVQNGDTISNTDLSPKLFGNWFSLGTHECNCEPASLKEISSKFNVSIYPNPSKGSFTIKGIAQNSSIEVINSLGIVIAKIDVYNNELTSFDNLDKGVYLVRISNDFDEQLIRKIVIE